MLPADRVLPRHLSDYLLSHGQPVIDLAAAGSLMGLGPNAAADALVRLRRSGQMFSPSAGLYIAIPPEYRSWGAIPALDFVDPMMVANKRQYYVALLSAAELHGASHQRPQAFQVMVDRPLNNRSFGRVRLRFYSRQGLPDVPVVSVTTNIGQASVSSPAATALDLVCRPGDAGGLSNVATVVAELAEAGNLAAEAIVNATAVFPKSALRRLGWMLDLIDAPIDRAVLANQLADNGSPPARVLLDPHGPRRGPTDRRWGVVVNADVEPDL